MNNTEKLIKIGEGMFGKSWQAQLADLLEIDRRTVQSWISRKSTPDWIFNNSDLSSIASRRADEAEVAYELAQGLDKSKSMEVDSVFYNGDLKGAINHFLSYESSITDRTVISYRIIYDEDNNYMFALKLGKIENWRHYLVRQSNITRLSHRLYWELKASVSESEFYKNMR